MKLINRFKYREQENIADFNKYIYFIIVNIYNFVGQCICIFGVL